MASHSLLEEVKQDRSSVLAIVELPKNPMVLDMLSMMVRCCLLLKVGFDTKVSNKSRVVEIRLRARNPVKSE